MPTVLVVDDTAVDRRLAGGLLENAPSLDVCYANNGTDAMLQIGNSLPDLVLTDLQMPDVDGLELVNKINERYPDVPVVLMTAHGSEAIAAQALASGAASYVPKTELADNLVDTVMHILAMSDSDARYKKLMSCAVQTHFEFDLQNDLLIISPLIDLIQQVISSLRLLDPTSRVRTCVAIEHALNNAMVRGNLEIQRSEYPVANPAFVQQRALEAKFETRRVNCRFSVNSDCLEVTIRDDGDGFDYSHLPEAGDPEVFKNGHGRGLVLIQAFMDQIEFSENGRQIKMVKFRSENPGKPR